MDMSAYASLLMLSSFGKIGPRSYEKLLKFCHLEESQDLAATSQLVHVSTKDMQTAGIKPEIAEEFALFRQQFDAKRELNRLSEKNIHLVSLYDEEYPELLKQISDPPYLLYVLGSLEAARCTSLSVVGSRKHTHYGKQAIEMIVPELVRHSVTIVSGLAIGIDALAHRSCLESEGTTIAVIGSGLDVIYPSDNERLAREIIEHGGAVISEYSLGTPPLKQHFPARNRLLAGISQATLVVECDIKSGAMITAHHALQENRDVFAIPGQITSLASAGPNSLLRSGAVPITSVQDVIEALGLFFDSEKIARHSIKIKAVDLPNHEKILFDILTHEPIHIDSLAELSKLEIPDVTSALLFLEMKGMVRNIGAAQYIKR